MPDPNVELAKKLAQTPTVKPRQVAYYVRHDATGTATEVQADSPAAAAVSFMNTDYAGRDALGYSAVLEVQTLTQHRESEVGQAFRVIVHRSREAERLWQACPDASGWRYFQAGVNVLHISPLGVIYAMTDDGLEDWPSGSLPANAKPIDPKDL